MVLNPSSNISTGAAILSFKSPHDAHLNPAQQDLAAAVAARRWSACIQAIAQSQDQTAFAELFNYFAPRLKTWLMRAGSQPAEAEELAQEVMVTVWQRAAGFDASKASASTWIYTIARNKRIDALRRQQWPAGAGIDIDEIASFLPDPGSDSAANALQASDQQRIGRLLKNLPANDEEVLRLAFFEEKTHQDVANTLGLPLGTVKSRIRVALQRLQDLWGAPQ